MSSMSRPSRRVAALGLGVAALIGLGLASAAQLSVSSASLGAGTSVVGTCQPAANPITVTFLTTFSSGQYRTAQVRVDGVHAACGGRNGKVQLIAPNGSKLGSEMVGSVPNGGGSWTIPVPSMTAASIGGLAGVIYD